MIAANTLVHNRRVKIMENVWRLTNRSDASVPLFLLEISAKSWKIPASLILVSTARNAKHIWRLSSVSVHLDALEVVAK